VKNTINSGKDKLTDSLAKYYSLTEHMELKLLCFSKVQSCTIWLYSAREEMCTPLTTANDASVIGVTTRPQNVWHKLHKEKSQALFDTQTEPTNCSGTGRWNRKAMPKSTGPKI